MKDKSPYVIFIDSGVDGDTFGVDVLHNLEVDEGGVLRERTASSTHSIGHGTTCAAIVKKYCPDYLCSSIKVLNESNWKCSIERLLAAIEWCHEQNADVVNISLGSTAFHDQRKILPAINKLAHDSLIVAAHSNRNIATYPSSFTNVIGVKATRDGEKPTFFNTSFGGFTVSAPARHNLMTKAGHSFVTEESNSCAAPYITAMACNDVLEGKSIDINDFLARLMRKTGSCQESLMHIRPDWIYKALLISDTTFGASSFSFEVAATIIVDSNSPRPPFKELMEDISLDTIIFVWREKDRQQLKQQMVQHAAKTGKDLVIIADLKTPIITDPGKSIKMWSPNNWCPTYQSAPEAILESPLIVILDESEERLLNTCRHLSDEFGQTGYNVPFSMNCPVSVLHGGFYIPERMGNISEYLIQMQHIYQANAHIIGVKSKKNCLCRHLQAFRHVAVDIIVTWDELGPIDIHQAEDCLHLSSTSLHYTDKHQSSTGYREDPNQLLFRTIFECLNYND